MFSSSFFNAELVGTEYDREYQAKDLAERFKLFFTNGVFYSVSSALQVIASNGLTVEIKSGACNIDGYTGINDSNYSLSLDVANALQPRIDAIVIRLDHVNRTMTPLVITGTPSASPVSPTLLNDTTGHDICLAQVRVSASDEQLYNADITDTRLDTDICGIVTQAVQTIDTTTLYQQFENSLNQFLTNSETTFTTWFNSIRETLEDVDVADLVSRVELLEEWEALEKDYEYNATGVNDNTQLSLLINNFLNANTTDSHSLKINVRGNNFLIGTPTVKDGTNYDFVFFGNSSNRRVIIDFTNCNKLISQQGLSIIANSNVTIIGLRYETTNSVAIESQGLRIEKSIISGAQYGISGTHVYAKDCKIDATGFNGTCVGVYCGGYLENCDVVAQSTSTTGLGTGSGAMGVRPVSETWGLVIVGGSYRGYVRASATTSEGVGIYIPSGIQLVSLSVTGARCPQVGRNNYVQTQSIKINTGYGNVTSCPCYKAPLVYSTINFSVVGNPINNITTGLI